MCYIRYKILPKPLQKSKFQENIEINVHTSQQSIISVF